MGLLETYAVTMMINLDDLDGIMEDYPEIRNISVEFKSDCTKMSTPIDKSLNYSSEDKKIIKELLLIFTNILIELNCHRYMNNDLLEVQKLIEI